MGDMIMTDKLKSKERDNLYKAILTLKSVQDCYDFFDDLCTIAEIKAMTQRFQVAEMLYQKTLYSDIVDKTGASTATISRVNRALEYGSDGYLKVLERLKKSK